MDQISEGFQDPGELNRAVTDEAGWKLCYGSLIMIRRPWQSLVWFRF